MSFFKTVLDYMNHQDSLPNETPESVDAAIADITSSLAKLEAVRVDKAQAAEDYKVQSTRLNELAVENAAEADRAARIHTNISALFA
jgi:hypothetical protein